MTAAMFSCKSIPILSASLVAAISVVPSCFAGKAPTLVIENAPQRIPEGAIKAKLHGVSVVTTSPMFLESTSSGVTIPTDVVLSAVKMAPELRKELNLPDDPKDITFSDVASAAKAVKTKDIHINTQSSEAIRGVYCGIPKGQSKISWEYLQCDDAARYNAGAITKLLAFDGLDTSKPIVHKVGGIDISFVPVRQNYADALLTGNETVSRLKSSMDAGEHNILDKSAWYDFDRIVTGSYSDDNVIKVAFFKR